MLWIEYKFSECLAPCTNMKKTPTEDFLATVLPMSTDIRGIWKQFSPNLFCAPTNFVVLRKICFKRIITTNLSPLKMYFLPQILKPGYGPGSAKIVSAIRIFCFEGHSASRCRKSRKVFFYKSPIGDPCKHFVGGTAGLLWYCLQLTGWPKHRWRDLEPGLVPHLLRCQDKYQHLLKLWDVPDVLGLLYPRSSCRESGCEMWFTVIALWYMSGLIKSITEAYRYRNLRCGIAGKRKLLLASNTYFQGLAKNFTYVTSPLLITTTYLAHCYFQIKFTLFPQSLIRYEAPLEKPKQVKSDLFFQFIQTVRHK